MELLCIFLTVLFCRRRLDIELPSVQSIWLEVKYKTMCFLLCVIYRPILEFMNICIPSKTVTIRPNMFPIIVVPPHFMHGNRLLSILHTRLRNNCSDLKHDLFINHVSDHDLCFYCNVIENVDHYFFHCNRYRNERLQLFRETRHLHPLNCKLLLYGSNTFTHVDNITIVEAVHKYIKDTKRFTS